MKKILSFTAAVLLIAGLSSGAASARHWRHHHHHHPVQSGVMTEPAAMFGWGSNAEMMGNNANSASGDNSLGYIKGGNIGTGR